MDGFNTITYSKQRGVARITLNRPRTLNAYNMEMRDELYQVLGAVREDDEVGAVVFQGRGRAFCAGAGPYGVRHLTIPCRGQRGEVGAGRMGDVSRHVQAPGSRHPRLLPGLRPGDRPPL